MNKLSLFAILFFAPAICHGLMTAQIAKKLSVDSQKRIEKERKNKSSKNTETAIEVLSSEIENATYYGLCSTNIYQNFNNDIDFKTVKSFYKKLGYKASILNNEYGEGILVEWCK